jgi:hypothetical protein
VIGRSEASRMGGSVVRRGVSRFIGGWACVCGARALCVVGVLAGCVVLAGLVGPVSALAASPWWRLSSGAEPSELQAGSTGQIVVVATNLGDADASGGGEPVRIADELPSGLSATGIEGYVEETTSSGGSEHVALMCSLTPLQCEYAGVLAPYRQLHVLIDVDVGSGASSAEVNEATISGGEAPSASVSRGVPISDGVPFGLEAYEIGVEEQGGGADTQAGSHPFQMTTAFTFNQTGEPGNPPALAKDVRLELPAGLIANSTPFAWCKMTQFMTSSEGVDECPTESVLGVASVTVDDPAAFGPAPVTLTVPVFNLEAAAGESARFGFDVENVPVTLDASVRAGTDYGITLSANDIPQTITLIGAAVTLWGMPGDARHDSSRGWSCVDDESYRTVDRSLPPCYALAEAHLPPLLTLPVSCTGLPETAAEADSWTRPGVFGSYPSSVTLPGFVGCQHLPFNSSIWVSPDRSEANTPAGFSVGWRLPEAASRSAEGVADSDAKDVTVALPAGMQFNPEIEVDPQGCSASDVGFTGVNASTGADEFTPQPSSCPDASKIAWVRITTLLLPNPLEGFVYLAARQAGSGPFETLESQSGFVAGMYLVAEDPVSGVLVKLPASLIREPSNGQLVMDLNHLPQLPIEETQIDFWGGGDGSFGGADVPFTTPAFCGYYTTTATFVPWSNNAPVDSSSTFDIDTGPGGGECPVPKQSAGGSGSGGGASSGSGAGGNSTVSVTEMPPAPSMPVVTILGSKLVISRGTATVRVVCSEAACNGSIELVSVAQVAAKRHPGKSALAPRRTRETLVLATGSFSLTQRHSRIVPLRLTVAGRRMLAHANKRHSFIAKLKLAVRGGKGTTKPVLVTIS